MLSKNIFLILALMFVSSFCFAQNFGAPSYAYDTGYVGPNDYQGLCYFEVENLDTEKYYFVLPDKFSNIVTAHVEGELDEVAYLIDLPHAEDETRYTWCKKGNQNPGLYFLKLFESTDDTFDDPGDSQKDSVVVAVDN